MKKLKANSLLAAIVFCVSILVLCSFGTDAAYVILSRYKLQKITESLALEYASSKSKDINGTEDENAGRDIAQRYNNLYNIMGSGVVVFKINQMEYKANRKNNEVIVKVGTTSQVMPVFLKFVGVRKITVYAIAYATTNKIVPEPLELETIDGGGTASGDFSSGYIINKGGDADNDKTTVTFSAPFIDKNTGNIADSITARNTGLGDFAIKYVYDSTDDTEGQYGDGGGFFVLGGYEVPDETDANGDPVIRWVDIGNKTQNISNVPRICVNPDASDNLNWATFEDTTTNNTNTQCFYCINAIQGGDIVFDLSKDTYEDKTIQGSDGTRYAIKDTGGRINTITHLRLYKAGGSNERSTTGELSNPCDPNFSEAEEDTSSGGVGGLFKRWKFTVRSWRSINRKSSFTLTILNNISLTNKRNWENFQTEEGNSSTPGFNDTHGSCQIEELPNADIDGN